MTAENNGRLQDRVALITGGASGIGQATAVRFAEEGAHVVIADLPTQSAGAEETIARVRALGRKAQVVAIDVTEEAQVEEMADAAVASFGRIDVLVAAAGISHDARGDELPAVAAGVADGSLAAAHRCQFDGGDVVQSGGGEADD